MTDPFFPSVESIPFEGPETENPLAFRCYERDRAVAELEWIVASTGHADVEALRAVWYWGLGHGLAPVERFDLVEERVHLALFRDVEEPLARGLETLVRGHPRQVGTAETHSLGGRFEIGQGLSPE